MYSGLVGRTTVSKHLYFRLDNRCFRSLMFYCTPQKFAPELLSISSLSLPVSTPGYPCAYLGSQFPRLGPSVQFIFQSSRCFHANDHRSKQREHEHPAIYTNDLFTSKRLHMTFEQFNRPVPKSVTAAD